MLARCRQVTSRVNVMLSRHKRQNPSSDSYAAAWTYIRKWERFFAFMILAIGVIGIVTEHREIRILLCFLSILMICIARNISPMCPRCGHAFFRNGLWRDGTSKRRCVCCGLAEGASPDSDHQQRVRKVDLGCVPKRVFAITIDILDKVLALVETMCPNQKKKYCMFPTLQTLMWEVARQLLRSSRYRPAHIISETVSGRRSAGGHPQP